LEVGPGIQQNGKHQIYAYIWSKNLQNNWCQKHWNFYLLGKQWYSFADSLGPSPLQHLEVNLGHFSRVAFILHQIVLTMEQCHHVKWCPHCKVLNSCGITKDYNMVHPKSCWLQVKTSVSFGDEFSCGDDIKKVPCHFYREKKGGVYLGKNCPANV
jgi:phage FluMu protein Com